MSTLIWDSLNISNHEPQLGSLGEAICRSFKPGPISLFHLLLEGREQQIEREQNSRGKDQHASCLKL